MYYLVKDSNGIEHCLQSNGSSYQDLITGEEYVLKGENLQPLLPFEAQTFCNNNIKGKKTLKKDSVIVLLKPMDELFGLKLHILQNELSKRGLYIKPYIPHIFEKQEAERLYVKVRARLQKEAKMIENEELKRKKIAEYENNISYLMSNESVIAVINGKNARAIINEIIGDKNSKLADPDSLRAKMGDSITCNAIEIVDDEEHKLAVINPIIRDYKNAVKEEYSLIKTRRN